MRRVLGIVTKCILFRLGLGMALGLGGMSTGCSGDDPAAEEPLDGDGSAVSGEGAPEEGAKKGKKGKGGKKGKAGKKKKK